MSEVIWTTAVLLLYPLKCVYTVQTKAKDHECKNVAECFPRFAASSTVQNIHIGSSSVLFSILWTQMKLHVHLHVPSVPAPATSSSTFAVQASTITMVNIWGGGLASDASPPRVWLISSHASFLLAYFPYFEKIRGRLWGHHPVLCVALNAWMAEETAVAKQRLGKRVPAATNTQATVDTYHRMGQIMLVPMTLFLLLSNLYVLSLL
jgi:hypothetical protein